MKKFINILLIALFNIVGIASLTSCSSDDDFNEDSKNNDIEITDEFLHDYIDYTVSYWEEDYMTVYHVESTLHNRLKNSKIEFGIAYEPFRDNPEHYKFLGENGCYFYESKITGNKQFIEIKIPFWWDVLCYMSDPYSSDEDLAAKAGYFYNLRQHLLKKGSLNSEEKSLIKDLESDLDKYEQKVNKKHIEKCLSVKIEGKNHKL